MLDKKALFRRNGVVPLLGLLAAFGLWGFNQYESFLKNFLEQHASLAYGARIEIETLSAKPFKGLLTLKNIQITNPTRPLFNLATLGKAEIHFSFKQLLSRKFVINNLEIQDISLNTQRKYSGILEDIGENTESHPIVWERTDAGMFAKLRNRIKDGEFKNLSQITTGAYTVGKLPDLKKTLVSINYLEDLNREFNKASRTWKEQANHVPTPVQVNQWQTQVAQWKKLDRSIASTEETQKRSKLAALLREKYETIQTQLNTANKDLKEFKLKMDELNNILSQDIETVKKALDLPNTDKSDLSESLYGLQVITALERLAFWSKSYRTYGQALTTKNGFESILVHSDHKSLVHFLNKNSYPSFFISKGSFRTGDPTQNNSTYILGEFQDFLHFSQFYEKNFKFALAANLPTLETSGLRFDITTLAHDTAPKEHFALTIESFPLTDTILRRTPDFEIKLASATGRIEAEGDFEADSINAKGHFEASGAKFEISSQFQPFEEMLDGLTKYRTSLNVTGTAAAKADDLTLNIESDFGKKLASSIKETFNQQLAQIDETLRANLLDSLFPLRQAYNETLQETETFSLAQMRSSISDLEWLLNYTKHYEPKNKPTSRPHAG